MADMTVKELTGGELTEIDQIPEVGKDCKYLIDCGNYEVIRKKGSILFWDKRLDKEGKRSHKISITFPGISGKAEMDAVEKYYRNSISLNPQPKGDGE